MTTLPLKSNLLRSMFAVTTAIILSGACVHSAMADGPHRYSQNPNYGRVWIPPVYTSTPKVVVVPAVYEERTRQVWHEPVYETRRVLVEEPAEVVRERVPRYDRHGRFVGYGTVDRVVRPARKVWREENVLIKAGHYDTVVDRVCVQPERKDVVYERVLLKPGYWTYVRSANDRPRYYSRDRGGLDIRGHYRDSDDWGVSVRVGN